MPKKSKIVSVGSKPTSPISSKEHKVIAKRIKKEREQIRKVYPEVHGKAVDFITHTVTDGTLYVSVRFMDGTIFCIRYGPTMFVVGVDFSDWKTGNMNTIREYIKPIPR
jgi:hypothetical protein